MGEDPSVIREQIENTGERMGETVEALGYKADVPSRAKENIQGKVDTVKSKVGGATPDAGRPRCAPAILPLAPGRWRDRVSGRRCGCA